VGLHRRSTAVETEEGGSSSSSSWTITFPPPSVHLEATPDVIRGWYERQLEVEGYKQFLEGFDIMSNNYDDDMGMTKIHIKPFIFGTIDDHDYGQNNGGAFDFCVVVVLGLAWTFYTERYVLFVHSKRYYLSIQEGIKSGIHGLCLCWNCRG